MRLNPLSFFGRDPLRVKTTCHIVFKTHLDVGFTDYASVVQRIYLQEFIPGAITLAARMNDQGGPGFVWTVGSWLVRRALDYYSGDRLRKFENAIGSGHVAWHALPFTMHSELVDSHLFDFGLSISQDLDNRFGRKTIAAKMTDVPGHTLGIVSRLAAAGVTFLHLGSNPGSTPPDAPELFVWRNPADARALTVMYQKGGYGDVFTRQGLKTALCVSFTEDNLGPPPPERIGDVFESVRLRFPNAALKASTFDAFARALAREKPDLPVVEQELGDTWIHGAGAAPAKMRRYRELCRLRDEWLQSGIPKRVAPKFYSFSENLLMVAEHTWGMDVKTHLPDDKIFTPKQLARARTHPVFEGIEWSWREQEKYVDTAVAALRGTPFASQAVERLAAMEPAATDMRGFRKCALNKLHFETSSLHIALDPATGAVTRLHCKKTQRNWAGPSHTLGRVSYQIFGGEDVARFLNQYGFVKKDPPDWFARDFGKPGLDRILGRGGQWDYALKKAFVKEDAEGALHVLLQLGKPAEVKSLLGAPRAVVAHWTLPAHSARAHLDLQWSGKSANRIPEALWVHFRPRTKPAGQWRLHKMGQWIDPSDVIRNGNRRLHAVQSGVRYREGCDLHEFMLQTLDAPLVSVGAPSLYDFTNKQPPLSQGMHVNLWNNVWGTNFPQWTDEDARFRFVVSLGRQNG
jgi:hypothetical protein